MTSFFAFLLILEIEKRGDLRSRAQHGATQAQFEVEHLVLRSVMQVPDDLCHNLEQVVTWADDPSLSRKSEIRRFPRLPEDDQPEGGTKGGDAGPGGRPVFFTPLLKY